MVRNTVQVTVPSNPDYLVNDQPLFVRVRAFDPSSLPGGTLDWTDFAGLANNGEIEDYSWNFSAPNSIALADVSARSLDLRWAAALTGLLLVGAGFFFLLIRKQKNGTA